MDSKFPKKTSEEDTSFSHVEILVLIQLVFPFMQQPLLSLVADYDLITDRDDSLGITTNVGTLLVWLRMRLLLETMVVYWI